jgi:hypothetical protein
VANSVWDENIASELDFWDGAIQEAVASGRNRARPPLVDLRAFVSGALTPPPKRDEIIRVLDVGSGPFSTLGRPAARSRVELTCVDALGAEYNKLFDRYGFDKYPRIQTVRGEMLSQVFGHNTFHMVNCANALDHFCDPRASFIEMLSVCRVGGIVTLVSVENEGRRQDYHGLHQWNLQADDDGVWLSGPQAKSRINLVRDAPVRVAYSWQYVDHGQVDCKIFTAVITKLL